MFAKINKHKKINMVHETKKNRYKEYVKLIKWKEYVKEYSFTPFCW